MSTVISARFPVCAIFGGREVVAHAILLAINRCLDADRTGTLKVFSSCGIQENELEFLRDWLVRGVLWEQSALKCFEALGLLGVGLEQMLPIHIFDEKQIRELIAEIAPRARSNGYDPNNQLDLRMLVFQEVAGVM